MNHAPEFQTPATPAEFRALLRRDLTAAMKARQAEAVSALRTALAAIDNAEAVEMPPDDAAMTSGPVAGARAGVGSTEAARRELSIAEVRALLQEQVVERLAAADQYESLGKGDTADGLRREAEVLQAYLPT